MVSIVENNLFKKKTFFAVIFYVLVVVIIASSIYYRNRASVYDLLDQRLAASVASIQYVLAEDFHDRALVVNSISPEEDEKNIKSLTKLAKQAGVDYLYTVVIQDKQIFITSSSASEEEISSASEVRYFTPYNEATHLLTDIVQKEIPIFITHTDRWGTFRAGLLLCESQSGKTYIAAAELKIDTISRGLRSEMVLTFVYSFLLLGATFPLYLVLSSGLRNYANSLKLANQQLKREQEVRIQLEAGLVQAQKMEAIGTLAGGIAHDFNNILGAILGYSEIVRDDSQSGSVNPNDIDQVITACYRAKDLVRQILAFSRQAEAQKIPVQLASIVKESITLLRSSIPSTIDIQLEIEPDTSLIMADPTQVHQIILNMCTNAYHSMEETGGKIVLSVKNKMISQQDLVDLSNIQPGQFVCLSIRDTGSGIAQENLKRIFDPYFTTKEIGKGTGMGLAIVHGIIKSYGGFSTCQSTIGVGTEFNLYIPALSEQLDHQPDQEIEMIPGGAEHILLVDDEKQLGEMGQAMLERLGYTITLQTNSLDALTIFKDNPYAFDLVITDQTMPGLTGFDLARRMLQIRPDVPIILCTGYSSILSEEKAKSLGIKGFAMKPLSRKDIASLVRKVLNESSLLS